MAEPTTRTYRCNACGRQLPHQRWVYSRHTGSRYCWPGEGCQSTGGRRRRNRR